MTSYHNRVFWMQRQMDAEANLDENLMFEGDSLTISEWIPTWYEIHTK